MSVSRKLWKEKEGEIQLQNSEKKYTGHFIKNNRKTWTTKQTNKTAKEG